MTHYKIGVAVGDITPPDLWIRDGRIWLWGFGSRAQPCNGIYDRLTARALAIQDTTGNRVALVTLDLGALDSILTKSIRHRVWNSQGIPPENLCIHVTHTHGAPVPVPIPTWQPGFTQPDPEYLQLLEKQIAGTIENACRMAQPATLHFARGRTDIAFDRHFGEPGFHDPTLDVLKIAGTQDEVIAIAFFTACHPVCFMDFNQIYTDFPGPARRRIEEQFGGTALFFQGYGGISNPKTRDAHLIGTELAEDVITVANGPMEGIEGLLHTRLSTIDLPFQPLPDPSVLDRARETGGIHARWANTMTLLGDRVPSALPAELQGIQLGAGPNGWYLAASSHEVTADFAPAIRALRSDDRVTTIGFSNSQLSYVPSRRVMTLPTSSDTFPFCTNYEGGLAFAWYGHRAPLALDVDERFIGGHMELGH